MRTSYYCIMEPFTSFKVQAQGGHVRITCFAHGAKSGVLTLLPFEAEQFIATIRGRQVATVTGGQDATLNFTKLSSARISDYVISDSGECLMLESVERQCTEHNARSVSTQG